ncbi:MAG: hypothetical protein MUF35_09735 [Candidatus Nanopelagicales bacterium]|nr:hypothetical protein [Candidatus Nanopelagicales bacterium]
MFHGSVTSSEARGPGSRPAAVPRVHAEVVVVPTGGGEERAGVAGDGDLEAEGVDVEVTGGGDVADLQVDVPDPAGEPRSGVHRLLRQMGSQVCVGVQMEGGHLELAAGTLPLVTRPIDVQLDAVALRVGEVEGLTDEVVRGADETAAPVRGRPVDRRREARGVVEQERGVEQAGLARVPGGQVRGVHEAHHRDPAAPKDPVDLAAAAALLDGDQRDGVRVVAGHEREVADPQGDGVHGGASADGAVVGGR